MIFFLIFVFSFRNLFNEQRVPNLVGDPAYASTLSLLRDQLDARVAEIDEGSGELYCAGDGSSGLCPCLFFGGAGEGCLHSAGSGARRSTR